MEKNNHQTKVIPRRMVRIDEDEEECLRRLAEPSTTTRYPHHKAKHAANSSNNNKTYTSSSRVCSNNNDNNKKKKLPDNIHIIGDHDHDHYYAHEVKKEVTQNPNKEKKVMNTAANSKLETQKSEDINESAENFIQKFKQQLILQRLESIENVEKMLQRGL